MDEIGFGGCFDAGEAAKASEKFLNVAGPDALDFSELRGEGARVAAVAMKGDGEAVGFVADGLNQLEHGRAAIEQNWFILVAKNLESLLAFGEGGQRLVEDPEGFQRGGGGVELAEAAVN